MSDNIKKLSDADIVTDDTEVRTPADPQGADGADGSDVTSTDDVLRTHTGVDGADGSDVSSDGR